MEENECLYLCQISPDLGNCILFYGRCDGAASYLSPVRASSWHSSQVFVCAEQKTRKYYDVAAEYDIVGILGMQWDTLCDWCAVMDTQRLFQKERLGRQG